MQPLRAYTRTEDTRAQTSPRRRLPVAQARPPRAEGRWSLVQPARPLVRQSHGAKVDANRGAATEWATAMAQQSSPAMASLRARPVAAESIAVDSLPFIKCQSQERCRAHRAGTSSQDSARAICDACALDCCRSMRDARGGHRTVVMAATDPANPYGTARQMARCRTAIDHGRSGRPRDRPEGPVRLSCSSTGARAYLRRGERELCCFSRSLNRCARASVARFARLLLHLAATREGRRGMLLAEIDGAPATAHPAARLFVEEGFGRRRWAFRRGRDKVSARLWSHQNLRPRFHVVASALRRSAVEVYAWLSPQFIRYAREHPSALQ
jgi:hypothetical protein